MGGYYPSALRFEPLFQERIWGGRRLADLYGKKLLPGVATGESWEIVDRPEAQSVVRDGPLRGKTLHELWMQVDNRSSGMFPTRHASLCS